MVGGPRQIHACYERYDEAFINDPVRDPPKEFRISIPMIAALVILAFAILVSFLRSVQPVERQEPIRIPPPES